MKKILLVCAAAFAFFAADAQTKQSAKKGKKPSANSKFAGQERQKKLARQGMMDSLRINDSLRVMNDSLADVQKEADRVVYRETGMKAIDSMNKEKYAALNTARSSSAKTERNAADIAKAANLSVYETKQVSAINQQYNEKARALLAEVDPMQKKQELIALNEERRAKIRVITGKAGEKQLEKERKSYIGKNGADPDSKWVDMAEEFARNK